MLSVLSPMRTILVFATAILILGTISVTSVYALDQGDQIQIKSKTSATCTNQEGDTQCGTGDLKSKTVLLVQGDENLLQGVGKTKISLTIESNAVSLTSNGLSFFLDPIDDFITVTGQVQSNNGNPWQLTMNISNVDLAGQTANCETVLVAPDGSVIDAQDGSCGIVLSPITS